MSCEHYLYWVYQVAEVRRTYCTYEVQYGSNVTEVRKHVVELLYGGTSQVVQRRMTMA